MVSESSLDIEKAPTASGTPLMHKHHLGGRYFVSHEGQHIHIAGSPQEAENLRKHLSKTEDPFVLCLQGSPEHLEALRKTHDHHQQSREYLRRKYGEIYEQFHNVHTELDWLAAELRAVTSQGVRLDASFSKYGYAANLRSYEDSEPSDSASSSATSLTRSNSSESEYKSPLKFFKVPVVRQYFHKGLMWRASEQQEVESFELFVDLLYVGVIAVNGDFASEDPNGASLLRFIITMSMSYKIWSDMTLMITWFDVDDISRRLTVLFTLACLFGFTTNITSSKITSVERDPTASQLVGFYLTARLFIVCYMVYLAVLIPMIRYVLITNMAVTLVCVGLWIGSIYVSWPSKLALIFIAIIMDIMSQTCHLFLIVFLDSFSPRTKAWSSKFFSYRPALNIEHKIERTNAFVSLVFGYSVVALIYQNQSSFGLNAFFGKAIMGLVQAFCFNWLYFEIDASNITLHAIRRHRLSTMVWMNAHLPFIMGFVLAGGALARLVVASDCDDANVEDLTDVYQARSLREIGPGIRWFYCGGLGIALASMGVIALASIHKTTPGVRLQKRYRILIRFGVALILILLPLASTLNSMQLVGITSSLVVFVLGTELWLCSCRFALLWDNSKYCTYFGHCPKKELERTARKVAKDNESHGESDSDGETIVGGEQGGRRPSLVAASWAF